MRKIMALSTVLIFIGVLLTLYTFKSNMKKLEEKNTQIYEDRLTILHRDELLKDLSSKNSEMNFEVNKTRQELKLQESVLKATSTKYQSKIKYLNKKISGISSDYGFLNIHPSKYKTGDLLFVLVEGKILRKRVESIHTTDTGNDYRVEYKFFDIDSLIQEDNCSK
jgi:hypothetical protein